MSWTPVERKIIMGLVKDLKDVLIALQGDIKTKEPGIIDDVRDIKKDMIANKQQHTWLFILCGAAILGVIFGVLGGDMGQLTEWAFKIWSKM